jgi:hypothetical protein
VVLFQPWRLRLALDLVGSGCTPGSIAVCTVEVAREFLKKTDELARSAKIPEIRVRLRRLADNYRQKLAELEATDPAE